MHDAQKVRFWIAAAAITAINVSLWVGSDLFGNKRPMLVRLAQASSAQEFEETGRLSLHFDREVYSKEQIEQPLANPPFQLQPEVKGEWIVRSENELAFEPDAPPPPGRIYRVGMTDQHQFFNKVAIEADDLPELRYQPLKLEHTRLVLTEETLLKDNSPGRLATIELAFNQNVSLADLEDHLQVRVDGKTAEPNMLGESRDQKHRFDVACPAGATIGLHLEKALTGHQGTLGLHSSVTNTILIPRGLHMSRVDAYHHWWRNTDPEIQIRFDRRLAGGQKTPVVTVTPSPGPVRVSINGQQMLVKGHFLDDVNYTIDVQPPLLAADGSVLTTGFSHTVRIPKGDPSLNFPRSIGRLGTTGAFELDLEIRRVTTAKVRIHRLLHRHIPIYLSGVMNSSEVPRLGEKVAERTITLANEGSSTARGVALDLDLLMERTPGVYLVSIESKQNRWSRDKMLLFVGDIGLEVQTDGEGMLAWVTDVESGSPMPGVNVVAWKTNRTELTEGVSDGYGLVRLDATAKDCDLITATIGEQFVFVNPRSARGLDDRALAGAAWNGPLDIALYAERGVHRPGETIHLSGVVRGAAGELPGGIPLEIRVKRPDDRVIFNETVEVDPNQGVFHVDLPTHTDSPTGNWAVTAHLPGDDKVIAKLSCPIMPFLPVRLAVEASTNSEPFKPTEVSVRSYYLHGAPAAGLTVKLATSFRPVRYSNENFETFLFEEPPTSQTVKQKASGTLDSSGTIVFPIKSPTIPATWRGVAEATVLELGGRPTTSRTRVDIDNATTHLGARLREGELYRTSEPITIEAIRLDTEGNPTTSGAVVATLESIDHEWNLVDAGEGRRKWRSVEIARPVKNVSPAFVVSEDNLWTCVVSPLPVGAYRLTTSITNAGSLPSGATPRVVLPFHVSDNTSRGRVAADRPDRIDMIVEDPVVVPGMETSVLMRSAFPGLALVTVETDRVHDTHIIEITGDGARIPFTVPLAARDTCFVAATLIRPLDPTRTQWLPILARGAARLRVDRDLHRVDVSISASDAARPGERVRVMLSVPQSAREPETTSFPAMVHLWAVDEGALLVTDYHVPNFVDRFLRDRRRVVASIGTALALLPDYERPVTVERIGGDASRRFREPVPNRQPTTAVLWRKTEQLPADGRMDLELVMPQIDGAMRIMAVVIDNDRFGEAEHVVGVVAPIQVIAAMPRAAAPGDTMTIPVRVRNNTAEATQIALNVDLEDGLEGELETNSLLLQAHAEEFVSLRMVAGRPGSARVRITAIPAQPTPRLEEQVLERWIAVRPPHGRDRSIMRLEVAPGATEILNRDRSLEALAGHIELVVGGHPAIDLKPVFDGLIQYPYGCGEQTGSRTKGLLAALRLPAEVTGRDHGEIQTMAKAGVHRLWWMQRSDGSIPYWRGGSPDAWLTLRTAIVAMEAQEQGVELPPGFLEGLLRHAEVIARPKSGRSDNIMAAYACRVLARAHTPDEALMAALASTASSLDLTSRSHLADAYFANGNLEEARRIIDTFTAPAQRLPSDSGRFTSGVHQAAVAMGVLVRNQPKHPMIVEYARFINNSRSVSGWRTTYENAEVFDALSLWHKQAGNTEPASGTLTVAGKTIHFDGRTPTRHAFDIPEGGSTGEEMLVSEGDGPVTLLLSTSGVPLDGALRAPLRSVIQITRTWFDTAGKKIEPGTPINAGDLITIELDVRSMTGMTYKNVAIVDVLPGGMEFELPTLITSAGRDKAKLDSVDRVEFRDDRLVAFSPVTPATRKIRYLARAIVPGDWTVPAPDALAMYDPEAHGRGSASRVEILLP